MIEGFFNGISHIVVSTASPSRRGGSELYLINPRFGGGSLSPPLSVPEAMVTSMVSLSPSLSLSLSPSSSSSSSSSLSLSHSLTSSSSLSFSVMIGCDNGKTFLFDGLSLSPYDSNFDKASERSQMSAGASGSAENNPNPNPITCLYAVPSLSRVLVGHSDGGVQIRSYSNEIIGM